MRDGNLKTIGSYGGGEGQWNESYQAPIQIGAHYIRILNDVIEEGVYMTIQLAIDRPAQASLS